MDADDELVPHPDRRGFLDLTNRAWNYLDPIIFTMSLTLVTLDVSYNNLVLIAPEIGDLVVLRDFRAAFNKLTTLPASLGRLKRLKRLILNGNKISKIPDEICKLEALEELILSENELEALPSNLSSLSSLRILKLQSNNLYKLPHEIAELITLEEIDCSFNKQLEMIPEAWRGNTGSILFICRIHRDYFVLMEEMKSTNADLLKHSQLLEQSELVMKENIREMRQRYDILKKFIPKRAMKSMERELKNNLLGAADGSGEGHGGLDDDGNQSTISSTLNGIRDSCSIC